MLLLANDDVGALDRHHSMHGVPMHISLQPVDLAGSAELDLNLKRALPTICRAGTLPTISLRPGGSSGCEILIAMMQHEQLHLHVVAGASSQARISISSSCAIQGMGTSGVVSCISSSADSGGKLSGKSSRSASMSVPLSLLQTQCAPICMPEAR